MNNELDITKLGVPINFFDKTKLTNTVKLSSHFISLVSKVFCNQDFLFASTIPRADAAFSMCV